MEMNWNLGQWVSECPVEIILALWCMNSWPSKWDRTGTELSFTLFVLYPNVFGGRRSSWEWKHRFVLPTETSYKEAGLWVREHKSEITLMSISKSTFNIRVLMCFSNFKNSSSQLQILVRFEKWHCTIIKLSTGGSVSCRATTQTPVSAGRQRWPPARPQRGRKGPQGQGWHEQESLLLIKQRFSKWGSQSSRSNATWGLADMATSTLLLWREPWPIIYKNRLFYEPHGPWMSAAEVIWWVFFQIDVALWNELHFVSGFRRPEWSACGFLVTGASLQVVCSLLCQLRFMLPGYTPRPDGGRRERREGDKE